MDYRLLARLMLLAHCALCACPSAAADLSCRTSATLHALIDCISLQMPQSGSGGYVAPTPTERAAFRTVVHGMLSGKCDFPLPSSLADRLVLRRLQDADNRRDYCVLMEVADADGDGRVDRGWGTFITFSGAERELSHHAPHPKHSMMTLGGAGDSYTERTALRIFRDTASRSYLMCGARRDANYRASTCQPKYAPADCAHNVDNMFHAANEELAAFYGTRDWTAIQWHGKARGSCSEDMFISAGSASNTHAKAVALMDVFKNSRSRWWVNVAPSPSCKLVASDNTQGRLLNGVDAASVCATTASSVSGKFLHIEQTVNILADIDATAATWTKAIVESFPAKVAHPTPVAPETSGAP